MATIYDVAKKAGVSAATISYVLNNKATEKISDRVKKKVLRVAKSLNYRPNYVARSLILRRTATLGVISDSLSNSFFYEILAGMQNRASVRGYALLLGASDLSVAREAEQVEFMLGRKVDGLLVVTVADAENCAHIKRLQEARVPFVLVDERVMGIECDYVMSENLAGARQAAAHLLALGHRRIGFVGVERWRHASTTLDRLGGYRQALEEAGVAFDPTLACVLPRDGGKSHLEEFLRTHRDCSALFLSSDSLAPLVFQVTGEMRIRIPEELAVVGFDDSSTATMTPVPLTTIRQPRPEMGNRAVEVLLERVEAGRQEVCQIQLPTELVVRRSCGGERERKPPDG